jgi:hypothetical protein
MRPPPRRCLDRRCCQTLRGSHENETPCLRCARSRDACNWACVSSSHSAPTDRTIPRRGVRWRRQMLADATNLLVLLATVPPPVALRTPLGRWHAADGTISFGLGLAFVSHSRACDDDGETERKNKQEKRTTKRAEGLKGEEMHKEGKRSTREQLTPSARAKKREKEKKKKSQKQQTWRYPSIPLLSFTCFLPSTARPFFFFSSPFSFAFFFFSFPFFPLGDCFFFSLFSFFIWRLPRPQMV